MTNFLWQVSQFIFFHAWFSLAQNNTATDSKTMVHGLWGQDMWLVAGLWNHISCLEFLRQSLMLRVKSALLWSTCWENVAHLLLRSSWALGSFGKVVCMCFFPTVLALGLHWEPVTDSQAAPQDSAGREPWLCTTLQIVPLGSQAWYLVFPKGSELS